MKIDNAPPTRMHGLALLGEGCKDCGSRKECRSEQCNRPLRYKYGDANDLLSYYLTLTDELELETYIRTHKKGYFLLVKGDVYCSGHKEEQWRVHFFMKDGRTTSLTMTSPNARVIKRFGKEYVHMQGLKRKYGIKDYVPLKNSKVDLW